MSKDKDSSKGGPLDPARKAITGGPAGRGPGRTYTATIKKTEQATPTRPPRGSGYSEAPGSKRPRKGDKPNDGEK